ncbi:MAG: hypothetical protein ACJA07_004482 [Rhodococcus sp. (in: high G+C Gram-positive bacteria)]
MAPDLIDVEALEDDAPAVTPMSPTDGLIWTLRAAAHMSEFVAAAYASRDRPGPEAEEYTERAERFTALADVIANAE